MLDWTKDKPKVEGYYLRKNPISSGRPELHFVKDMRAEFPDYPSGMYLSWSSSFGMTNVETLSNSFWWYGPIPTPPYDSLAR